MRETIVGVFADSPAGTVCVALVCLTVVLVSIRGCSTEQNAQDDAVRIQCIQRGGTFVNGSNAGCFCASKP